MSGLKSAWELSLERSDQLVPELKKRKKLTQKQKKAISEIRTDYKARIADKDVTLLDKLNKLADRTPPEMLQSVSEELKEKFIQEKKQLEEEMEKAVEAVRTGQGPEQKSEAQKAT